MSKEQTPIEWLIEQICTDVEIHDEYGEVERVEYWNAFRSCTDLSTYIKQAKQKEQQYAQYREKKAVQKALEEDVFPLMDNANFVSENLQGNPWCTVYMLRECNEAIEKKYGVSPNYTPTKPKV